MVEVALRDKLYILSRDSAHDLGVRLIVHAGVAMHLKKLEVDLI